MTIIIQKLDNYYDSEVRIMINQKLQYNTKFRSGIIIVIRKWDNNRNTQLDNRHNSKVRKQTIVMRELS